MAEMCSTVEMISCGLIQVHICIVYTQTHALTDETTAKKKSRCSISIQNSFQMRFIYGPYTSEHIQKRLDLTRASSTLKIRNLPFLRQLSLRQHQALSSHTFTKSRTVLTQASVTTLQYLLREPSPDAVTVLTSTVFYFTNAVGGSKVSNYGLEFITNLMHNFTYSIIILHHVPQHVSSIAVLIFRRTIVYLQYLVSSHSVCCHTEWDNTRYCKYTIVLLKTSTAMLETCCGS
jgi:hypothetical protein